jgi:hypothetical protein
MTSVLTVLEARVAPEHQHALQEAYRAAAESPPPSGLVRSILLRDSNDPLLWRIETMWTSREALAAMRGTGTPRGVLIFRAADAEPTLTVLDVVDHITPTRDAA